MVLCCVVLCWVDNVDSVGYRTALCASVRVHRKAASTNGTQQSETASDCIQEMLRASSYPSTTDAIAIPLILSRSTVASSNSV